MNQEPPSPAEELKPWYYQYWFLYPVIVFWPVWAVLILRSPWHNGLVSGAVAWAMLFVGGYLIGWRQLYETGELNQFTTTIIIPGLMLTVLTQVFWIRDKKRLREANREGVTRREAPPTGSSAPSSIPARSRRTRNRRRSPRSGRSGRSNRGR